MEKENVNLCLRKFEDQIPQENYSKLKKRLTEAQKDDSVDEILSVKLVNPIMVLLFSIFIGWCGADRFLIGDTTLGILKIIFGIFTLGIWHLADIFITYKRAQELNYRKIIEAIDEL